MPKIITIAHQKGGVGKSTLALNLAYAFMAHAKTVIIDLDPQGTLLSLRPILSDGAPTIVTGDVVTSGSVKKLPYDLVIIDTPPYNNNNLPALLEVSDLVLIPTKAGAPDMLAIDRTIGFANVARQTNKLLKAGIVINMVKARSALTSSFKKDLAGRYDIPVLAEIRDRVSYSRSVLAGGIDATGDTAAINEINGLVQTILQLL